VDGAPCQLLTGTAAIGDFQFWIDERTALLRKAVLQQKAGDSYWQELLPRETAGSRADAIVGCHLEISDLRLVRVGEKWVPTYGICTETLTYRTGAPQVMVETAERSEFHHRPDFAAVHAFEMDGFADGQTLRRNVAPGEAPDTSTYFWKGGKITTAAGAPLPAK
jgi:hypothetical protein